MMLAAQLPFAPIRTTGTQTALVGQVREPAQLDTLLEKLLSVGLVLDDVHRIAMTSASDDGAATYEVRVAGEIGASLLSYLQWQHYIVPEQIWVRVAAGSIDLLHCLEVFTAAGASIEQVRRVFRTQHLDYA